MQPALVPLTVDYRCSPEEKICGLRNALEHFNEIRPDKTGLISLIFKNYRVFF